MKPLASYTLEELHALAALVAEVIEEKRADQPAPTSPWDDPEFSLSGKPRESIYRTRGFVDLGEEPSRKPEYQRR